MTDPMEREQLQKYAEDLKKIYEEEKNERSRLEQTNNQLQKFAEDLNRTIQELREANKKLHRQVEVEEKEKLLQKKMIHINKMTSLGTLAAGIAHEINNPISYILGNAQILADLWVEIEKILSLSLDDQKDFMIRGIPLDDLSEMVPKMLRNTIEGARQISQITGKLKDFSRPYQDKKFTEIDINETVRFAVAVMDKKIKKRTHTFEVDLGADIPPVSGNAHELGQVFINLIQNALQALPDDGGEHGIRIVSLYNETSERVMVKVIDEGAGMSAEVLDRVMEPFFTTRAESGGTGLGLYICYSIVKATGGTLDISSQPSKGTEVTIGLPPADRSENK